MVLLIFLNFELVFELKYLSLSAISVNDPLFNWRSPILGFTFVSFKNISRSSSLLYLHRNFNWCLSTLWFPLFNLMMFFSRRDRSIFSQFYVLPVLAFVFGMTVFFYKMFFISNKTSVELIRYLRRRLILFVRHFLVRRWLVSLNFTDISVINSRQNFIWLLELNRIIDLFFYFLKLSTPVFICT